MADESIDSFVTPEKNEDGRNISKSPAYHSSSPSRPITHASHLRASIGSYHAGDSSKKNSTEKSDSANSNRNVVPNYLRASTGSCHDFCKYGKKHSSEEKARKPLRRRISKPLPNEHLVLILVSGERNKEKVVNHKSPKDTKNRSPDLNHSRDSKSYSPKPKTSLDKKRVIKNEPSTDTKKIHSPDKKTYLRKPKNSSDAKTYSPKQNDSSGNKSVLPKSKPLSTKKCTSPDPPEIVKSVFFPSKKDEDPGKRGSSADNKMLKAEKKTTYLSSPVQSKPVKVKPLLSCSSDNSDGIRGKGRKNSESNTGRNTTTTSKASVKKVSAPPAANLSTKLPIIKTAHNHSRKAGNVKLVSYPKDRNRIQTVIKTKTSNNEKVSEKILHVIATGNKNNVIEPILSLPSPPSATSLSHENSSFLSSHEEDNEETEYSNGEADEFISDKNESLEIICKVPPVKENHNKTLKKTKVVVSEDNKNRSPVKLKFRNGKVVDVQSISNTPRRLRFRRARVIGADEGKSDLRRRIFKKAAVNDVKTREGASSEKVILKHQDVQGKKDAQGLLNNVIEQTASKLVESRKSKVKALVGAFETVISLQESKPSSQAVG